MNATLKATLVEFMPGPKAVTIALTSLMLFLDHVLKLGINETKVIAASVSIGTYIVTHTNTWGELLTGTYWAQFIPTPKVLTMLITPVIVLIDHKFKLGIPPVKIFALAGTLSLYLLTTLKKSPKAPVATASPSGASGGGNTGNGGLGGSVLVPTSPVPAGAGGASNTPVSAGIPPAVPPAAPTAS